MHGEAGEERLQDNGGGVGGDARTIVRRACVSARGGRWERGGWEGISEITRRYVYERKGRAQSNGKKKK